MHRDVSRYDRILISLAMGVLGMVVMTGAAKAQTVGAHEPMLDRYGGMTPSPLQPAPSRAAPDDGKASHMGLRGSLPAAHPYAGRTLSWASKAADAPTAAPPPFVEPAPAPTPAPAFAASAPPQPEARPFWSAPLPAPPSAGEPRPARARYGRMSRRRHRDLAPVVAASPAAPVEVRHARHGVEPASAPAYAARPSPRALPQSIYAPGAPASAPVVAVSPSPPAHVVSRHGRRLLEPASAPAYAAQPASRMSPQSAYTPAPSVRPPVAPAETAEPPSPIASPLPAVASIPPRSPQAAGNGAVRHYSVHREFGIQPDPTPIPPQFFTATADLSGSDAADTAPLARTTPAQAAAGKTGRGRVATPAADPS